MTSSSGSGGEGGAQVKKKAGAAAEDDDSLMDFRPQRVLKADELSSVKVIFYQRAIRLYGEETRSHGLGGCRQHLKLTAQKHLEDEELPCGLRHKTVRSSSSDVRFLDSVCGEDAFIPTTYSRVSEIAPCVRQLDSFQAYEMVHHFQTSSLVLLVMNNGMIVPCVARAAYAARKQGNERRRVV